MGQTLRYSAISVIHTFRSAHILWKHKKNCNKQFVLQYGSSPEFVTTDFLKYSIYVGYRRSFAVKYPQCNFCTMRTVFVKSQSYIWSVQFTQGTCSWVKIFYEEKINVVNFDFILGGLATLPNICRLLLIYLKEEDFFLPILKLYEFLFYLNTCWKQTKINIKNRRRLPFILCIYLLCRRRSLWEMDESVASFC